MIYNSVCVRDSSFSNTEAKVSEGGGAWMYLFCPWLRDESDEIWHLICFLSCILKKYKPVVKSRDILPAKRAFCPDGYYLSLPGGIGGVWGAIRYSTSFGPGQLWTLHTLAQDKFLIPNQVVLCIKIYTELIFILKISRISWQEHVTSLFYFS